MNWLGLRAWRRSVGQHWTERARLSFPVHNAAANNLWLTPAILTLSIAIWMPQVALLWLFTGLAAVIGTYASSVPLSRD